MSLKSLTSLWLIIYKVNLTIMKQCEESVLKLFKKDQEEEKQQQIGSASDKAVIAQYTNVLNYSFPQYYQSLSPEEQLKEVKILQDLMYQKKIGILFQEKIEIIKIILLAIKYSHKDYEKNESKYKID